MLVEFIIGFYCLWFVPKFPFLEAKYDHTSIILLIVLPAYSPIDNDLACINWMHSECPYYEKYSL